MSNQHSELPPHIEHVFRNLILYFIERQRLVMLAMLDLNPIVLQGAVNLPSLDLEPYIKRFHNKLGNLKQGESYQVGIWKNDWKHWVHGIGCRLTHIHTGEYLEWDAVDANGFDMGWFCDHLMWRLEHESDDPFVAQAAIWLGKSPSWKDIEPILESSDIIEMGVGGISRLKE